MPRQPDPEKDEPLSLAPLDFETALRALLCVDLRSEPPAEEDPVANPEPRPRNYRLVLYEPAPAG